MRILIITFTKGVNPGTVMQALGVLTAIEKLYPGAQIKFLDFPDFKANLKPSIKVQSSFIETLKRKFCGSIRLFKYACFRKKHFKYTKTIDLFQYNKKDIETIKGYDLIIIGSDTILEKAYNKDGVIGLNWLPIKGCKKIYFAASASPAKYIVKEDIKAVVQEALYIGLRDTLTINHFANKIGVHTQTLYKQPDPSFYLNLSNFQLSTQSSAKLKSNERYAMCNFNPGFPYREKMANALRDKGFKVVSTAYTPYADICLDKIGPEDWAASFSKMALVVTERFHDTVFALRHCCPVISIDWEDYRYSDDGDSKTLGILSDYNLSSNHYIVTNESDLQKAIKGIDSCIGNFDIDEVNEINNKYIKEAYTLLEDIKRKVDL